MDVVDCGGLAGGEGRRGTAWEGRRGCAAVGWVREELWGVTHTQSHTHTHVHTHTHMHTHTHAQSHCHTCTHTHTHARCPPSPLPPPQIGVMRVPRLMPLVTVGHNPDEAAQAAYEARVGAPPPRNVLGCRPSDNKEKARWVRLAAL